MLEGSATHVSPDEVDSADALILVPLLRCSQLSQVEPAMLRAAVLQHARHVGQLHGIARRGVALVEHVNSVWPGPQHSPGEGRRSRARGRPPPPPPPATPPTPPAPPPPPSQCLPRSVPSARADNKRTNGYLRAEESSNDVPERQP
ncbi:unnamed protein product [Closterium sp. NIES-53]